MTMLRPDRQLAIVLRQGVRRAAFLPALLGLALGACTADPMVDEKVRTLRVVVLPFLSFGPLFIAEDEGYFRQENLAIEFVRLPRNPEAIPALARGDLDVASGVTSVTLLGAIERGAEIRFVAGKGHIAEGGCTSNAIMARRELVESGELDQPADLAGLRVDVNRVLLEAFSLDRLLAPEGLGLDDLTVVDVPPPAESEALASGAIDVVFATEPDVTRLLTSGEAVSWRGAEEIIPGFQHSSLLYGPSLLEGDVDAGERFMLAYLRGVRRFNEGKTERNLEILARHTGLEPALLRDACWPAIDPDGGVNIESIEAFQSWAVERGLLDSASPRERLTEPRFAQRASRRLDEETR